MPSKREIDRAQKARRRLRNQRLLLDYKNKHGCQECGERDPVILEFHHPGGTNERRPTDLMSSSIKRLEKEMSKCQVLCCNCHRRTHKSNTEANVIWIKTNGHKIFKS